MKSAEAPFFHSSPITAGANGVFSSSIFENVSLSSINPSAVVSEMLTVDMAKLILRTGLYVKSVRSRLTQLTFLRKSVCISVVYSIPKSVLPALRWRVPIIKAPTIILILFTVISHSIFNYNHFTNFLIYQFFIICVRTQ